MIQYLLIHPRDPSTIGGVQPARVDTSSIAAGLWVATLLVLALPSPGVEKHRVREEHLLKGYQVALSTFSLL